MSASTHPNDANLTDARERVATAFEPESFNRAGHSLVDCFSKHLQKVQGRQGNVLNWADPRELTAAARKAMVEASVVEFSTTPEIDHRIVELADRALASGINLHHPRYVGHQVPPPVPMAALFDLIGTVTNQAMAIFEMGPWATAVERAVIDSVGEQIGFLPNSFAGLVTSGGSLANLTALITARNVALSDAWAGGLSGHSPAPVIVAHADAHYSISRAAGVMGLGTNQIIPAVLDEKRRIDANRLDETLADLRQRNVPIVAVVGCACATPIGAFDPLNAIADVCRRHEVWMHADAAHGGAVCFSQRHRHLVDGLALADSVICDAHKMMFMPSLCAMVFYRNQGHRFSTFHQEAPYLFDPSVPHLAEYESGLVNIECTKRAAAMGLWGVWSSFGKQLFADLVDVTFDLGRQFYEMLTAASDFEAPYEPECNIVVFRYLPKGLAGAPLETINAFLIRLRRKVIESGDAYLVASTIDGKVYLRTTLINPLTNLTDLEGILDILRKHGDNALQN